MTLTQPSLSDRQPSIATRTANGCQQYFSFLGIAPGAESSYMISAEYKRSASAHFPQSLSCNLVGHLRYLYPNVDEAALKGDYVANITIADNGTVSTKVVKWELYWHDSVEQAMSYIMNLDPASLLFLERDDLGDLPLF